MSPYRLYSTIIGSPSVWIPRTNALNSKPTSEFPLQLVVKSLQFVLARLLRRPADHQSLIITFARLRNDVEVYMVHNLMGDRSVVLQNVVVLCAQCNSDFLCEWKSVCEVFIWKPVEFLRV